MGSTHELWEDLAPRAERWRASSSVRCTGGSVPLVALFESAQRLADRLARHVPDGSRVVVSLANGRTFIESVLAVWRLGGCVALAPVTTGDQDIRAILGGAGIDAVIGTPETLSRWSAATTAARELDRLDDSLGILPFSAPAREVEPRWAVLKFSAGTTSTPKAIALTAANVAAEAENVIRSLALGRNDAIWAPTPWAHSYGFDLGVLPTLFAGATLIVPDRFLPRAFFGDLQQSGATIALGVPSIYRMVFEALQTHAAPSGIRRLVSCTAPLPARLIAAFQHRFGHALCQHYGSSEAGGVTLQAPNEALSFLDAVGRPLHGVTVRIVGPTGAELPDDETGRVLVESDAVASRYLFGGPVGQSPFRPRGVLMGDFGLVRDGLLYLQGRADDLVNVGGLKVSPAEVVAVLDEHPSVLESAVAGSRDERGEEVVYAAVVLRSTATEAELLQHCRLHLAEHKVPRRLDILPALPRGPSGKVNLTPARREA